MNKRDNTQKLSSIIDKVINKNNLRHKIDQLNIIDIWRDIIGESMHKYVKEEKVKDLTLYIKLKSSVVRNEISYNKSRIIENINKRIGKQAIKEIILK
tara:strand:- start:183 stop:476 length:294 start_codon:yes stop_codon:yes gene_type:complete